MKILLIQIGKDQLKIYKNNCHIYKGRKTGEGMGVRLRKPGGIIALLDEACMFPKSTHETFSNKLYQNHKRFIKPKLSRTDFTISHYAGKSDQFLDKNKDNVVPEHQDLLSASKCPFVAGLFPPFAEETFKSSKFSSIGSRFKLQLQQLMETLNSTEPHYIRCVKPNNLLKPAIFENVNIMQQLCCGGVLEAIRISCAGYPTCRAFFKFVNRFSLLDQGHRSTTVCQKILEKVGLKGYQIGKSKVFLRAGCKRTGALKEAKDKPEKSVEELTWLLQLEKSLRTNLEESKAQEIAKLQNSLREMLKKVDETNAMLIKERENAKKAIEEAPPVVKETQVIVEDPQKIESLTVEVEGLKRADSGHIGVEAKTTLDMHSPSMNQRESSEVEDKPQKTQDILAYWLSNASTLLLLLQRTLKASGAAGVAPQRRCSSSGTLFGRMTQSFRGTPAEVNLSLINGSMSGGVDSLRQVEANLLLRRECCSFSNGEYVKAGLAELEDWSYKATDEVHYITLLSYFTILSVIHKKPKKTLDEISHDLFPVLSIQQLYRISTLYWDDKYGTRSVSPDVKSLRIICARKL
ncbi:Myosin-11 protein [Spatholobus suberectus]|nr:Myosin-11 protein [Spatholobus suberectus]